MSDKTRPWSWIQQRTPNGTTVYARQYNDTGQAVDATDSDHYTVHYKPDINSRGYSTYRLPENNTSNYSNVYDGGSLDEVTVTSPRIHSGIYRTPDDHQTHMDQVNDIDNYVNATTPNAFQLVNAGALGGVNNLSVTQWVGRARDTKTLFNGKMTFPEYVDRWYFGNNGIFTDKYAEEHPKVSAATNFVIDAVVPFGKFAWSRYGKPYTNGVISRYKLANTKVTDPTQAVRSLTKALPYRKAVNSKIYLTAKPTTLDYTEIPESNTAKITGGVLVRKPTSHEPYNSVEMHLNPKVVQNTETGEVLSSEPSFNTVKEGHYTFNKLPSGTEISDNSMAVSLPRYVQSLPWKERMKYYLANRIETPYKSPVEGFSTDVGKQFVKMANKGQGVIVPSVNTSFRSTNIFGKSFDDLKFMFGKPDVNGEVYFKDMTPNNVALWNAKYSPEYGFKIDPVTRTSPQLIIIKK